MPYLRPHAGVRWGDMNDTFRMLIPIDKKQEERCMEIALKLADDMEEREMQQLDDLISGFWLEPPRVRATVYDAGEPLFVVADLDVWLLLDSGDWGPEVPVMEPVPATDPMTGQPALDLMGQPLMTMQPKGMAPEVLGNYWRNMWCVDRTECLKMMRDYAAILKAREAKVNEGNIDLDSLLG